MNYTYILECQDGTLYTGWTNDLDKRLKAHNGGTASKYTRTRRPVKLVYYESFDTKKEAMQREYAIKHLTREQKEKLMGTGRMQKGTGSEAVGDTVKRVGAGVFLKTPRPRF